MSDRVFGGIGLALAVFIAWGAMQIELSFISDPVGPRTFPIIIAVVMGVASLVVLLRPDPEPVWPALPRLLEIGGAAVVMIGYALLLPDLGFIVATAIAAAYLTWRLGTGLLWSALYGVLTAVGIYVIFHLILGLSLAEGPLGF